MRDRSRPYSDLLAYYGSNVPAFSTDDILGNRLDFEIARDGFVRRLRDDAALRNAETWLRREGYRVIELDAGAWQEGKQMHIAFATALQFPSHFGKNLDALNDCMSDAAEADYGWDATETGLVLILSGFERFTQRLPRIADDVQHILRRQGRYAALFGNRLLTILS
ncbi:RNAse (barnase) inhibitor barstar [Curtobacterium sp. SORGH_AS776]|nr:RNAse (barnase) inhibitor barstar [Curtobacterium sp. SORGH_AS_0776]